MKPCLTISYKMVEQPAALLFKHDDKTLYNLVNIIGLIQLLYHSFLTVSCDSYSDFLFHYLKLNI